MHKSLYFARTLASVLALASIVTAQGSSRAVVLNDNRADLCGHINAPITAYARHGRVRTNIGLIKKCMCMSELPQHLYTDETARAAVHVIGERATLDTLTDMLEAARDAQTCLFPPNSIPQCTPTDPCNFVCEEGFVPHPNAYAPTSCRCMSGHCNEEHLELQPPTKAKREARVEEALRPRAPAPSLKPRSPAPSLKPRSPSPSLKARSPAPSLKARSPAPSLKARSPAPSLKPRSPAPSLKPRSPAPSLKPRSPAPSLKPRSPAPSLKPRSPAPSLKPRSPAPSLKPRSPAPSLKPRSPAPSLKPRAPGPSLKPREPAPSLYVRAPEPVPAPVPSAHLHKRDLDELPELTEQEKQCGDWSVCGVYGGSRRSWECVNTLRELESCGGCMIPAPFETTYLTPAGRDCTAIPGVNSVECSVGSCLVHSCVEGWEVSEDASSCIETHKDSSKGKMTFIDMAADYGLEHIPFQ